MPLFMKIISTRIVVASHDHDILGIVTSRKIFFAKRCAAAVAQQLIVTTSCCAARAPEF